MKICKILYSKYPENVVKRRWIIYFLSFEAIIFLMIIGLSAANTAIDLKNHAKNRNDKRLAALEYLEAGRTIKDGVNEIRDYTQLTKQVKTAENIANQSMSDAFHGGSFNQAATDQRVDDNMKKNKIDKA